jgi:anti-sigma factor RsiW
MRCDEVRELLALFAGGEGSEDDRPGVEAHVALCAACARELDEVRELRSALSSLGDRPVPPADSKAVWRAVRGEFFPRRSWKPELLRFAAALVVGLGLGAGGWFAMPRGGSELRAAAGGPRLEALPAAGFREPFRRAVADPRHHLPRVEAVLAPGERDY